MTDSMGVSARDGRGARDREMELENAFYAKIRRELVAKQMDIGPWKRVDSPVDEAPELPGMVTGADEGNKWKTGVYHDEDEKSPFQVHYDANTKTARAIVKTRKGMFTGAEQPLSDADFRAKVRAEMECLLAAGHTTLTIDMAQPNNKNLDIMLQEAKRLGMPFKYGKNVTNYLNSHTSSRGYGPYQVSEKYRRKRADHYYGLAHASFESRRNLARELQQQRDPQQQPDPQQQASGRLEPEGRGDQLDGLRRELDGVEKIPGDTDAERKQHMQEALGRENDSVDAQLSKMQEQMAKVDAGLNAAAGAAGDMDSDLGDYEFRLRSDDAPNRDQAINSAASYAVKCGPVLDSVERVVKDQQVRLGAVEQRLVDLAAKHQLGTQEAQKIQAMQERVVEAQTKLQGKVVAPTADAKQKADAMPDLVAGAKRQRVGQGRLSADEPQPASPRPNRS